MKRIRLPDQWGIRHRKGGIWPDCFLTEKDAQENILPFDYPFAVVRIVRYAEVPGRGRKKR